MPYHLEPQDTTLQSALRRIAAEELGHATTRLDAEGGIHDVRKSVKKLRALIRLLRPGFAAFRTENAALRDAAGRIGGLRDAEVLLATLDSLDAQSPLRPHFADHLATARAQPDDRAAAADLLRGVEARARGWKLTGKDRAILAQGLATTRSDAQAAMAAARDNPDVEVIHDWRKGAKSVWYQARLLAPVWPEVMAPVIATADDLGEMLGRHHDLAVFIAALPDHPAAPPLTALALAEQDRILTAAFASGARLHAGDPAAVAALWVAWWRLWRG